MAVLLPWASPVSFTPAQNHMFKSSNPLVLQPGISMTQLLVTYLLQLVWGPANTQLISLLLCILCSPFDSCLHATTLAHSSYIHSPSSFLIFWLPIHFPCYLHLVSQHPSLLTRICTLMRRNCEPQLIKLEVQVVIQTVDHYNYS